MVKNTGLEEIQNWYELLLTCLAQLQKLSVFPHLYNGNNRELGEETLYRVNRNDGC